MKTLRITALAGIILPVLGLLASSEAAAQTRTPWQMHEGREDPNVVPVSETIQNHGNKAYYQYSAGIPAADDQGWKAAPNGEIIGMQRTSKLSPGQCLRSVDFTYFQTMVNVPANVTVTDFRITFSGMDDGARITIFNSTYPQGGIIEGSYVYLAGTTTANLSQEIVKGETNRVVVTQIDDCGVGNYLESAQVVLDGQTVQGLPDSGNSAGDVHIRTPDGLIYDFQAAGDFLSLTSADGTIVVQARQAQFPMNPCVTVNIAVALNVNGDQVGFYVKPSPSVYINGTVKDVTAPVALPRGGRIERSGDASAPQYVVRWPNGFVFSTVLYGSSHLDYGVSKPPGLQMAFDGLVGNLDGKPQNDYHIRNGTVLSQPVSLPDLNRFGDSWRISSSQSLFRPGAATAPSAPAASLTAAALPHLAKAQRTCEAKRITDPILLNNCITDVGATGEELFAESAQRVQQGRANTPAPAQPVIGTSSQLTTLHTLIGQWIFEGPGASLQDKTGRWGEVQLMGASFDEQGLQLTQAGWARAIGYQGPEIAEKTLIAWLKMNDLRNGSPAGGPLSLDAITADNFDGIVFGERVANAWMAGSSYFLRTNAPPQAKNPRTAQSNEILKLAITYKLAANGKVTVSIYKNDVQAESYEQGALAKWAAGNVEVLFGPRHTVGNTKNGFLNATLLGAEIHSAALTAAQLKERGVARAALR